MKRYFNPLIILFASYVLPVSDSLFAGGKGIIVGVCDRYSDTVVPSLYLLREVYQCKLPIEVWYAGDELSLDLKNELSMLADITFCDIAKVLGGDPRDYRGYQIKGYMMKATDFDEVILMDADVFFFEDPSIMFNHTGYLETGAYLFRDHEYPRFGTKRGCIHKKKSFGGVDVYLERKDYIQFHIPEPSKYVLKEWRHYWNPKIVPTISKPIPSEHVETGCVIFDRQRHAKAIEHIVAFNDDRATFFRLFLGEKETFWLGLEKAKEPYYINPTLGYSYIANRDPSYRCKDGNELVHFVNGRLFFMQKQPFYYPVDPVFVYGSSSIRPRLLKNYDAQGIKLTSSEIKQFQTLTFWYRVYSHNNTIFYGRLVNNQDEEPE